MTDDLAQTPAETARPLAVVTGASSGIGAALAPHFARVVTGQQRPADSVREAVRAAQRHYRT